MTIIVFLIDTSASMNQRAYLGGRPTLLDVAKGAVETFVKVRQRSPESRGDRYMLITFEDPPANIKAGWKENLGTFMNELKNLQCVGMTTMGAALKHAFDVLNINRMQTGIDTYGQGRCPYFLEPSVIVVITDGGKLSNGAGVQEDFNLPMHSPIPGSELTREPFRWDQRLFSLVLRLSGTPAVERDVGLVPRRSYSITSHRMLMQCIDSLVQKVQSGVVINFEKIGPDPLPVSAAEGTKGESELVEIDGENKGIDKDWDKDFNPSSEEENGKTSPPRSAHPNVKFTCTSQEPMVIENLPFDKYELEPSPLTQYILARKQPTICWQVFVANSYKNSEVGHPFGYLKASTSLTCVNLFVMPYNYPVLLPLLEDLFKVQRLKPTAEWRTQFQNYIRTMPTYYSGPLRRALTRMGAPGSLAQSLLPDNTDNSLSYSVLNYLKRLKNQAKIEFDRLCNEVGSKPPPNSSVNHNKSGGGSSSAVTEGVRVTPRSPLKKDLVSHPLLQDKFTSLREQLNEFGGFVVGLSRGHCQKGRQSYRNPFDIPRRCLLDQVIRMRANFLQPTLAHTKLLDDDFAHSMPVSQMGNYQEYLKRMQPQLREIESTPVRQHMFGNPFKIDKRMMVDEADIDPVSGGSSNHGSGSGHRSSTKRSASQMSDPSSPRLPSKRKPGPIPRNVVVRRPSSPSLSSPSSSPCPSPPWLASDLPPPLLIPVIPCGAQGSTDQSRVETTATISDSDGSEPPVLTMVNGDLGDLSHGGSDFRPRSPSPPPLDSNPPHLEALNNHVPHFNSLSPPMSPAMDNHVDSQERRVALVLTEISSNHVGGVDTIPVNNELCKKEIAEIKKHNLNVRMLAYKEVRRPGKNFAPLFNHLQNLKGSLDLRVRLLKEVIHESLRFKRRCLAGMLEDFLRTMIASTNNSHNSVNNHRPSNNNGATRVG
ncbi:Integrator complex subunit 6-A [Blattella germanica]|nr:Integrator complex subunit 6-A [Blattella germanica]